MNRTVIGIAYGILLSALFILILALWPLPQGVHTSRLDSPAPPTQGPISAEAPPPAIPESVVTEPKAPNASSTPPSAVDQRPKPEGPEPSEATASIPGKAIVKTDSETKPAEEDRKIKPASPRPAKKPGTKTAKKLSIPASPIPAPPSPSDLEQIHSTLNTLRSAYLAQDLEAVGQVLRLSISQEIALKDIFISYKNLRADLEAIKTNANGVTSSILITSLENEAGNTVLPALHWAKQPLIIGSKNNDWDQISMDKSMFNGANETQIDLFAPLIVHSLPAYTAAPGEPTEISAVITDNIKVEQAALHFRAQGERVYDTAPMSEGPDHIYSGRIPGSMIKSKSTSMEYYIEAKDAEGNVSLQGRPNAPLVIAVVQPAAP
jgi:hypothetical protein